MENPIRRSAASLTEDQIAAAEDEIGLRFPQQYRDFLTRHNGGKARRITFYHTNKKGNRVETWLDWIFALGHEGKLDPADEELITIHKSRPHGLPAEMLQLASAWFVGNTGTVCIACDGSDAGKVFLRPNVDPEKSTVYPVADSWEAFLAGCEYEEGKAKKWKELIQDGDAEGLRQLLEKKSKWQDNAILKGNIEQEAVEEGHWSIVELLIEKDWSASNLFTRALGSRRFDLARGILWTDKVSGEAIQECLTESDELIWYLLDFVAELIDKGADINHQDSLGRTPLHMAVEARSEEGVRFLIERGADPTAKNDDRRTPAALAQRLEEPRLLPILREAEEAWNSRPAPDPSSLEVAAFDFHGVTMTKSGPALTIADIAAFERETGLEFPPEYRGFLLKTNGGIPEPNTCVFPSNYSADDDDDDEDFDADDDDDRDHGDDDDGDGGGRSSESTVTFNPLLPPTNAAPTPGAIQPGTAMTWPPQMQLDPNMNPIEMQRMFAEAASEWRSQRSVKEEFELIRQTGTPRRMLPIGYIENFGLDGGALLLSCKGKDKGRVFYRDGNYEMHEEHAEFVIESLDALFRLLGEAKNQPATPRQRGEQAVAARDLAALRAVLVEGLDPLQPSPRGVRTLDLAMQAGWDDAVMAMIEAGASLDEIFPQVVQYGRMDLANRLLDHGKGPSKQAMAEAMCNPFLYADPNLVKRLLDRKASLKKGLYGGWAPLLFAAQSGNVESAQILLDAGASINTRTETGESPLSQATSAQASNRAAMVKFLLERGAKVNVPNAQGETALHQAVRVADLEAARLLIEAGEDLHTRHPLSMPGVSPEQQAKMARQAAAAMQQMMGMLSGMGDPDEDAPPPIDTSTPMGEMLAKAQEGLQQRLGAFAPRMEERMREMSEGGMGKGQSAAQVAETIPEAKALLPELEKINAGKEGKQVERSGDVEM